MTSRHGSCFTTVHPFYPTIARTHHDRVVLVHSIAHDLQAYSASAPVPWTGRDIDHIKSRIESLHRLVDHLLKHTPGTEASS